jgi:hypothetical protein
VLAATPYDFGLAGLAIEHNHTVWILFPKLPLVRQISLKRTKQSRS